MKIIFYISSLGKGGAERVISNLANYFSTNKNNNVMIVLERPTISYEVNKNVKIISLEKKVISKRNFIQKKLRYLNYLFKLKKIFNEEKPDLIVSFLAVPAFMALMAKNKKSKIIISVRNDPKTEYTTFLKRKLMKLLYPKSDGIVFQTKDAQDYFKDIVNCKQKIIYNAVSTDFINLENSEKKEKKIVSVGRLHFQKNYQLLINAFTEIADEYPNYNLIIYGEGNERENLQKIIEKSKMKNRITLAGNVNDVKNKIKNSYLYVMSSDFEGMPNSLIEAMVLGLPVISTDCPCGGPKELIINNKNGLLVPVNNKSEMIKAIKKILDDKDFADKIGNEAKKIVTKVDPKVINKQWEEFFLDVCSDAKK